MDAHLKHGCVTPSGAGARAPAIGALCALWCAASVAADISDPTLPPAPLRTEVARGADAAPAEPPRLQMIVRGPGESRFAVVDGRALRVGEHVTIDGGAARVLRITEATLVVRRADLRIETIELAPGTAQAVRCTRVVGITALPCATESAPGLEKTK